MHLGDIKAAASHKSSVWTWKWWFISLGRTFKDWEVRIPEEEKIVYLIEYRINLFFLISTIQ